ncbi:hypothetical protein CspHIS471_0303690 [Cutaneotrichosporon sp. HIS471]|nr:hypothetical protein CspHIS471_0303690 [Cutaneotrichosporon sp. HIS471]
MTNYTNGDSNGNAAPAPVHETYHFNTRVIHAGSEANEETGAVIPPISLATTYKQTAVGVHKGFEYTRSNNPNRLAFEALVASLELPEPGDVHVTTSQLAHELPPALAFSSGSAATQAIVSSLVKQNGHIVSVGDVYGGTYRYFTKVAVNSGIETSFVHISMNEQASSIEEHAKAVEAQLEASFRPETQLVWIETPTNPTLSVIDVETVARVAHAHGAVVVVDNTFMSSYYQQPLRLGADIVVHSVTKYLNGHSDVIMGVLVAPNPEIMDKLRFYQNAGGAVPGQFDSWLAQRGAKTLHLRMQTHGANALEIARWLQHQSWVREVLYPGLEGAERTPVRHLAWKQLSPVAREKIESQGMDKDTGFPYGGMVSFRLDAAKLSSAEKATVSSNFLSSLKIFTLAESLGGVESLAELPSLMTHASVSAEDRAILGIDDELIRLSVGIEDVRDLERDLAQAAKVASRA